MSLQFKPEMYLNGSTPAGYDVDLLHQLAAYAHVKLDDQQPRFQRPDPGPADEEVRHGLGRPLDTPARAQVISFSNHYVPYALIVAVPASKAASRPPARRSSTSPVRPSPRCWRRPLNARRSRCSRRRRSTRSPISSRTSTWSRQAVPTASSSRTTCWRVQQDQPRQARRGEDQAARRPVRLMCRPARATATLTKYLNTFLCTEQKNGTLATLYEKDIGTPKFPGLPACKRDAPSRRRQMCSSSGAGRQEWRRPRKRPPPACRSRWSTSACRSAARSSSARPRLRGLEPRRLGHDYARRPPPDTTP